MRKRIFAAWYYWQPLLCWNLVALMSLARRMCLHGSLIIGEPR